MNNNDIVNTLELAIEFINEDREVIPTETVTDMLTEAVNALKDNKAM